MIAFLEAHIHTVYLDNPVVVDHVRSLGSAEARRILEARLEAARAAADEPTSDSNLDSNPGGRGQSAADARRSL